jgi:hypothetical protein
MRLHQAIDLWERAEAGIDVKQGANVCLEQATMASTAYGVPIKRVGTTMPIVYVCAIAHRLATQPYQAATIATQLAALLQQQLSADPAPLLQSVIVHATAAGFIQFEVGDRAIAAWLDLLLINALPPQPLPSVASDISEAERQLVLQSSAIFAVQHAHARCCSLLQLANGEGLIRLERLEDAPCYWSFSSLAPFPWLTSIDQLCCNHSVDRGLLGELFDACDCLSDLPQRPTQVSLLRSAQAVAQAFQAFHREHPLWRKADEESACTLARLGLLMATQRVLYLLLWHGFALCPASAL